MDNRDGILDLSQPAHKKAFIRTCGAFFKQAMHEGRLPEFTAHVCNRIWSHSPIAPGNYVGLRVATSKEEIIRSLDWANFASGPYEPNIHWEHLFAIGHREFALISATINREIEIYQVQRLRHLERAMNVAHIAANLPDSDDDVEVVDDDGVPVTENRTNGIPIDMTFLDDGDDKVYLTKNVQSNPIDLSVIGSEVEAPSENKGDDLAGELDLDLD
ncbi:hypothetical protein DFP72DRAFT_854548 [Ephemerocybe angulata]|uniref:Uncharacterized protein n=1 Tax=Ephemerocybe angulata TaxID=980116 RepID=A0A8H6M0G0_9AGAR|nr:hypothetical protein DFP72DRAFT_854548 [Tulosesus angulatus]